MVDMFYYFGDSNNANSETGLTEIGGKNDMVIGLN